MILCFWLRSTGSLFKSKGFFGLAVGKLVFLQLPELSIWVGFDFDKAKLCEVSLLQTFSEHRVFLCDGFFFQEDCRLDDQLINWRSAG